MPVTERDVNTVSKQQNEEKFGEIGEEQVKPRAPGGSAATLQHTNGPQNTPETTRKLQKLCFICTQYLDLPSPKRTPQDDEDRPAAGWCRQPSLR